jgi:branched-chain amino acid transport system permease protein
MERAILRRSMRTGAVAGLGVLYVCAVGMVGSFNDRNLVAGRLSLGDVVLWLPVVAAGFVATRAGKVMGQRGPSGVGPTLASGALAGAASSVVAVVSIAVVLWIDVQAVRGVLIAVSQDLIDILTFHRSTGSGLVIYAVMSVVFAVIGAALRLLPSHVRHGVVGGAAAVVAMGLLQRIVPTAMDELGLESDWLYDPIVGGLSDIGAVLTFAVAAAAVVGLERLRDRQREAVVADGTRSDDPVFGSARKPAVMLGVAIGSIVLAFVPQLVGSIVSDVLGFVGIGLLLALGLNIIVGNAGLLHLGFVVFYAVGAYLTALLMGASRVTALGLVPPVLPFSVSFWVAVPIVMVAAALIGVLIAAPTVRLRGDYLAIVTLGFGSMALILVQSDWLKSVLGGPQGLRSIPAPALFGIELRSPEKFYYLALGFCALAVFVSYRLTESRVGRAWNAMREDEQVAETMGISVVRYKLLASAVGGALGGLAGALFAVKIGSLTSQSFIVLVSITALAIIILGGLGSIRGAMLGAFVLIGLPQLLTEFEGYRLSIYGAALIGIMLFRPQGLLPNVRRARELQDEERAQDAWAKAAEDKAAAEALIAEVEGEPA